jgi:hypothetical protein
MLDVLYGRLMNRGELTTFPGGLHPGERPGINGASFTVLTRWRQYYR